MSSTSTASARSRPATACDSSTRRSRRIRTRSPTWTRTCRTTCRGRSQSCAPRAYSRETRGLGLTRSPRRAVYSRTGMALVRDLVRFLRFRRSPRVEADALRSAALAGAATRVSLRRRVGPSLSPTALSKPPDTPNMQLSICATTRSRTSPSCSAPSASSRSGSSTTPRSAHSRSALRRGKTAAIRRRRCSARGRTSSSRLCSRRRRGRNSSRSSRRRVRLARGRRPRTGSRTSCRGVCIAFGMNSSVVVDFAEKVSLSGGAARRPPRCRCRSTSLASSSSSLHSFPYSALSRLIEYSMPNYIDVPSFPLSHGGRAIPAVGLGAS